MELKFRNLLNMYAATMTTPARRMHMTMRVKVFERPREEEEDDDVDPPHNTAVG